MTDLGNNGGGGNGDGGAAAAAAAGANGGSIPWLPGVDTDTAKFISDKKVPDLVTLAKNYVEANKTLSTPRAFEVPKAEDKDNWGKINAARGVPEAPDKYDLGELKTKVNPEAIKPFLPLLHEAGVSTAGAQKIIGLWSNDAPNNAWAYIANFGWRKISPASDNIHLNLLTQCISAKNRGAAVSIHLTNGMIDQIYN